MQRIQGQLVLSPTDLTKHVACPHLTTLDLAALDAPRVDVAPDEALQLVFTKGLTHEQQYLHQLVAQGRTVVDVAAAGLRGAAAEDATLEAMRGGADVIYQATFHDGAWTGMADFLLRVDGPSGLGDWYYDIADTKLARRLKVPALLQMATYAERLQTLQGRAPQWLTVVTGDGRARPWRLVDVAPYARRRRAELMQAIDDPQPTEPIRVSHCSQCRWKDVCAQQWLDSDDLIQVAGMRSDHRAALRANGIATMQQLAEAAEDELSVLSHAVRGRLHAQARLQVRERDTGQREFELLPPEPFKGLNLLPEPDPGDVYLDFEGDPWAQGGAGREYLAGIWVREGQFVEFWAHDFAQEGRLTADLVDWLTARRAAHPGMHIYHYAPYETTALKRLVGQHATHEAQLDQLLRAEVFVDLYSVVKQGIRISKPSYSIKKLEDFYWGQTRAAAGAGAVADGLSSVVEYERYLTSVAEGAPDQAILDSIRTYNIEDVRSTLALHEWLEQRRADLQEQGHVLSRPEPRASEPISPDEQVEIDLHDQLVATGDPDDELLAGLVGWHRREKRPEWWAYFRYRDLETPELVEDPVAIGGLSAPELVEKVKRSNVWRYTFTPQECRIPVGEYTDDIDTFTQVGKVVAVEPNEGWVHISRVATKDPARPRGISKPGPMLDKVVRESIRETARLRLAGEQNLATRLLAGQVPAAADLEPREGETPSDVVVRVGAHLRGSVLAVQGPPGTGKTFTGARLIKALLDSGLRVGVTALSHEVIRNLLSTVDVPALHKVSNLSDPEGQTGAGGIGSAVAHPRHGRIAEVLANQAVDDALASGQARLVGGTAWLWSRPEMREAVDVLIIDEAGQFSLANAVAVAQAATSLVLLGDPQQLTQPTKATHPYGSGVSVLDHLIGGHDVIPADRGVFLGTTYRMHPQITRFVSELAYESQLKSAPARENIDLSAPGHLTGVGLRWVPVAHEDRATSSPEEVEVVVRLVAEVTTGTWRDHDGIERPVTAADVLVVAPYNDHVGALRSALPPEVAVGTVDKFQGKQAAVVIYSMGSSTANRAPRGVSFLYEVNRLNVALSRAKALAVVVASPQLLDAAVHSPEDLRAVNALCRLVEQAEHVMLGDGQAP